MTKRKSRRRLRLRSTQRQRRSRVVSIRFSPREYGEIVNFAISRNRSVSSLIREVCSNYIRGQTTNQIPFSPSRIIGELREVTKSLQRLSLELCEDGNNSESPSISCAENRLLNLVEYLEKINF